jgi:hypothetical protein
MAFAELDRVSARQQAPRFVRALKATAVYTAIALITLWATLALFFDLPFAHARIVTACAYILLIAAILHFARRRWQRFVGSLLCFLLVLSWWLTLKPSSNQPWQTDVSKLASIDITNNHAIIHNFRQCDYRTELDYTCTWSTLDIDLAQIQGVDLFMNYWGSPWIAHTIVSFDLGRGQHVAFSIETRKQVGQTYSALRGFFRQYTLISVVSDERDLVRLRTNYRDREDLYLYHTRATPVFARSLFLDYAAMTNRLYSHPQWYNAITHNCTTEIFTFKTMKDHPFDWRILLNGKADEMEYQRGELAGDLPFPELKQRAYINPAARAADKDPQFSVRIREGRPGFAP